MIWFEFNPVRIEKSRTKRENLFNMPNTKIKPIKSKENFENSPFFLIVTGQKWPWINKIILYATFVFTFPFRKKLRNSGSGSIGHLGKLIRLKRFEEGYSFGLEQLSRLSAKLKFVPKNPKSFLDFAKAFTPMMWCFVFEQTCTCASEINEEGVLEKMETIYEQYSGPKDGNSNNFEQVPVGRALSGLASLAWRKKSPEAGWEWINKAVESEKTYGYSYYLRAWMGEIMGVGQPVNDLILAIGCQPELEEMAFEDETFLKNENLLTELKERLEKPN